jgi:putative toxin-antitoxin system antitoxin component (TIGR02293 family)
MFEFLKLGRKSLPGTAKRGTGRDHDMRQQMERRLRVGCLTDRAEAIFKGDMSSARKWLNTPNAALDNKSPLAAAETETGAELVEALMLRIERWLLQTRNF